MTDNREYTLSKEAIELLAQTVAERTARRVSESMTDQMTRAIEDASNKMVSFILIRLRERGIDLESDTDDAADIRRDLEHARSSRRTREEVEHWVRKGFWLSAVAGVLTLLILGLKDWFKGVS